MSLTSVSSSSIASLTLLSGENTGLHSGIHPADRILVQTRHTDAIIARASKHKKGEAMALWRVTEATWTQRHKKTNNY